MAFQSSSSRGFARFNDETPHGPNCPKLVTNSQKRIFQFFARRPFLVERDGCGGGATFLVHRRHTAEHWKFISRNNMSLNCKIGESMHCYQSTRLIKCRRPCIALCAQKQTWLYWDLRPTGKDHLLLLIESHTLITGL